MINLVGVWVQVMEGGLMGSENVLRTGLVLEELPAEIIVRWYDQQLGAWLYAETVERDNLRNWRFYFDGAPVLVAGEQ